MLSCSAGLYVHAAPHERPQSAIPGTLANLAAAVGLGKGLAKPDAAGRPFPLPQRSL